MAHRVERIGLHLSPIPCPPPPPRTFAGASPTVPLTSSSTLAEAEASHRRGSGALWSGDSAYLERAMQIFMEEQITNFPLEDVEGRCQDALLELRSMFGRVEAEQVDRRRPPPKTPAGGLPAWAVRRVLITGTTGFLGVHVLAGILSDFPDARIDCLVRGRDEEHCLARVIENADFYGLVGGGGGGAGEKAGSEWDRVHVVKGDVKKACLGMSPSAYEELVESTDTVLHFAAKDNFFLPYSILCGIHVGGVLNVAEFCARGRVKSLLYVSTCKYRLNDQMSRTWTRLAPNGGLYDGYSQSKYVGHRIAEEIHTLGQEGRLSCVPPICMVNFGYVYPDVSIDVVTDVQFERVCAVPWCD